MITPPATPVHAPRSEPAPPPVVDPAQTRMVLELKHASPLVGCRIDPTGQWIFAGSQDNSVQRWHLASGKKTGLAGHKSWIRALAFGAREKWLFSGSWDGKLLDLAPGRRRSHAAAHHRRAPGLGPRPGRSSWRQTPGFVRQRPPGQALVDPRGPVGPRLLRAMTRTSTTSSSIRRRRMWFRPT